MTFPVFTLQGSDCSVPVTQFFALRAVTILVAIVSEKDIWQHIFQNGHWCPMQYKRPITHQQGFFFKYIV